MQHMYENLGAEKAIQSMLLNILKDNKDVFAILPSGMIL
jgi:hypothetical protein